MNFIDWRNIIAVTLTVGACMVVLLHLASHVGLLRTPATMRVPRRIICALNRIAYVSDEGIVFQRDRHSCGLACVQMLLGDNNLAFGRDVLDHYIGLEGMSMLDMARILEQYGYQCRGVRFGELRDLAAVLYTDSRTKAIAVLDTERMMTFRLIMGVGRWFLGLFRIPVSHYKHWVVVDKIDSSTVRLRDPVLGRTEMHKGQFQHLWEGETLVVHNVSQQAGTAEHETAEHKGSLLTGAGVHGAGEEERALTQTHSPPGSVRGHAPVVLEKVSRIYQQSVLAVRQASFELLPGEVFCLLGPNGAGKTTLVKMITAVLPPSSGRIILDGVDVWAASDTERAVLRRSIGYMPERPFLYDKLTPREYLTFIGELCGVTYRTLLRERIAQHLRAFRLEDKADTRISKLSHGMRRKVAFIAAQLHEPRLSGTGHTVLMTTHVLEIAERLADRIGVIDHGALLFTGTLSELRDAAGSPDADLEDLFLKLVEPGAKGIPESDTANEEGTPHA